MYCAKARNLYHPIVLICNMWYDYWNNKSEFGEVVKMKDGKHPNPNTIHPIAGYDKEIYVKPTITNPNIIVGDFTYIADSDFESHV